MKSAVVLCGWVCAAATVLAPAPAALGTVTLYGWQTTNGIPGGLVRWRDPPSGGTVRIGLVDDLSFDPSFSPQGILYGTDGNSFFTINLSTGQPSPHTHITGHNFDGSEFLIGLAFAPSGTLFAWSLNNTSSGIFTISTDDGVATLIRANTPQTLFGMTFGLNGTMYASDGSHLMRLDPANGNLLQTIGTFPQFITSLGYGPDGVLRGLSPHFSTHGSDLYSISLSNASTTFLGSSVEDIYGIASIPAPAALALFAAGALATCHRRRRPPP